MATLQVHNSTQSSNVRDSLKSDHDNASVTTETSGYASAANDDPSSSGEDFKSAFTVAKTINEEDYISPMALTGSGKESGTGKEVDQRGATHFFGSDAVSIFSHDTANGTINTKNRKVENKKKCSVLDVGGKPLHSSRGETQSTCKALSPMYDSNKGP